VIFALAFHNTSKPEVNHENRQKHG
jgi:hypothetical protein